MSKNEAPIFKIKRDEIRRLVAVEGICRYIKRRQPLVTDVYSTAIYFGGVSDYITWGFEKVSDEQDDMFLITINEACNTNIVFDEGAE